MPMDMWLGDFEAAEQLGQEAMELINERNSLQRTGASTTKVQSHIRGKMNQYSQMVKSLQAQLLKAASSHTITPREVDRRQNQIDSLLSKERQLNQAFRPSQPMSSATDFGRSGLLNEGFDSVRGDRWGASSGFDPEGMDYTPGNVAQQQQTIIEEQDKGLDELSKVIQRQKMMGNAIGEELDYHNELIDDITTGVERTNRKLHRETKHTQKVTKKSGGCCMIVIIILLFIGIVVTAVYPK